MIIPNKIEIANIPTPLHALFFEGFEILIKRDDYTGTELSGNKIRKLEYLVYDALEKNADCLVTCGGVQSNHCRATAAVAARFGLKCMLYLRGKEPKVYTGNLAMMELFGAEIKFLNDNEYDHLETYLDKDFKLFRKKGIRPYYFPSGGSSELGIWGYIEFCRELKNQMRGIKNKPSHIITAVGSGGTLAGMVLGKKLFGLKSKLMGFNVLGTAHEFEEIVVELANSCSRKYKLGVKVDKGDFQIIDGYSKEGYENISDEKLQILTGIALESGIIFDPAYTGKAFFGMIDHFIYKCNDFNKLLFVHTGGIFGVFSKLNNYLKHI